MESLLFAMLEKLLNYFIPSISTQEDIDDSIEEQSEHRQGEIGSCQGYGLTKEEVLESLKKYIKDAYNDDWNTAFKGYANEDDPDHLSFEGLCFMLRDSKCGNTLIRPVIATAIIVQLDKDEDRKLTFEEFLKIKDGDFIG